MPRFRLVLEYDGSDFQGWQAQAPGVRTVQDTLEAAAAGLAGAPVAVLGAGRTDAGVHAEGQVASLAFPTRLGAAELSRALNALLPEDLAVLACDVVGDSFDPRRDARSKLYRYDVWNGPERSPLRRRRWHRVPGSLDTAAMVRAVRHFEGTHDFAALRSMGSHVASTERTLLRCELVARDGELRLFVEGTGFLRHMVRTLAGTLLEVGAGGRAPDSIPDLLARGDRGRAGPTAPARGLTLVAVRYDAIPARARPDPGFGRESGRLGGEGELTPRSA